MKSSTGEQAEFLIDAIRYATHGLPAEVMARTERRLDEFSVRCRSAAAAHESNKHLSTFQWMLGAIKQGLLAPDPLWKWDRREEKC